MLRLTMWCLQVLLLFLCSGIVLPKPGFFPNVPYLFWTTNTNSIQYVNNTEKWIYDNESPNIHSFKYGNALHKHLGCSYDHERAYLLFSDNSANTISLLGETNTGKTQGTFVNIGTSSGVGHVAVDWISSNVYWSDSLFGWIGLQALPRNLEGSAFNRKFRVVVDKFLDIPSGLAVHANKRFLFWTDTGTEPKIERSGLDGSGRRVLIWAGILNPVSVAVDVHSNTLYFTDPARETVESCDLEGNARRILYYETNSVFYGIETFKNYVIVSDQSASRILVLSNSTGQKSVTPLKSSPFVPFSLGLFTPDNQPVASTACDSLGCDQICIYTVSGALCFCEDGYSLLSDNKTCNEIDKTLQRSILFASDSRICHLPVNAINSYKYVSITIQCDIIAPTPDHVSYFAISMETNEIFYAKENTIFRQDMFENVITSNYSSLRKISGMDYDWLTDTLYWSEQSVDKIFLWNVTSGRILNPGEIAATGLGFPKALKVDPFKKRIFYIDSSSTQSIKVVYLTERRVDTLESHGITSPAYLHFDRRKDTLFWSDHGRSALGSVRSDGSNAKFKQLPQGATYSGVTVYKDYLLWLSTNHSKHALDLLENTSLSSDTAIKVPLDIAVSGVLDLRIFDRSLQPSVKEPCITENDGCQHICVVQGEASQCACRVGYRLQPDNKTCLSVPVASHFLLTTDIQMNRLYQIDRANVDINAVDILAGSPKFPDFDDVRGELVWWDQNKNTILKSSFDGTNAKALKGGVQGVGGLAIDHSTGNVFYASNDNIYVTTTSGNAYRKLASGTNVGSIQVDSKRGVMAWVEGRPYPKIVRSYMDGTNMETVISNSTHAIVTPMDIAIDSSDGNLVWCDDTLDKIDVVSMSTLSSRTVISNRGEYPVSVAVLGEYIYYIAKDRRSITKISKITGSQPTALVSSPLFGKLFHLSIYEDNKQKLHKLCSNQNGMCSKFCLPRGESSKKCACNDGEQVDSEGLCPGDVQCPSTIPQGAILTNCRRLAGDLCQFTCDEGYQLGVPMTTRVVCGTNGKWNETNDLCRIIKCQGSFENGKLSSGCSLEVGATCGYTCHSGYIKSGSVSMVCNKNGAWNEELSQLCKLVENETSAAMIGGIAGSAVGLVLIIVIVVVVCLFIRRNKGKSPDRLPEDSRPYVFPSVDVGTLSSSQMSTYTTLTDDGGSVYSEIKEERAGSVRDQPNTVEIPPLPYRKHQEGIGSSFKSERYARFPHRCEGVEGGYLDPYYSKNSGRPAPEPDYDDDDHFVAGSGDGYLDMNHAKDKDGVRFQRMPRRNNSDYNNDYFT